MAKRYGAVPMAQGIVGSRPSRRRKAKDSDYKLSRVEIVPADNGYTVSCYHEPKDKDGGQIYPFREPKKLVYRDVSSMLDGVSKYFES